MSEQVDRLNQLAFLRENVNPYPAAEVNCLDFAKDIKSDFTEVEAELAEDNQMHVRVAGRIMSWRTAGKTMFLDLQDSTGRIQLYIRKDAIGEDQFTLVNKGLSHGDIISVNGYVFRTKLGEITIHVEALGILSKSIRPLPTVKSRTLEDGTIEKHYEVTDSEFRYRQRYADMIINPETRDIFIARSKMIKTMRNLFDNAGFLEVETPILQTVHGGATARPFATHHNTLDMPLTLRIANELYLKRLIVGGFNAVYEFGKMFRNEGMDRTHNPEFTSVEAYMAYKDYNWMMDFCEVMIRVVSRELNNGKTLLTVGENQIDFNTCQRMTLYNAIKHYTRVDISEMNLEQLQDACRNLGMSVNPAWSKAKLIDELFSERVEHHLIQPTFIMDYPHEMSPLAKQHRDNPELAERFELYINGKEIANAYSEQNDPIVQRERFEEQLAQRNSGDDEAMVLDEDFLRAIEYGMPPTAGIGIGVDRLAMLLTNQSKIQEVLFFPQMKAEVR